MTLAPHLQRGLKDTIFLLNFFNVCVIGLMTYLLITVSQLNWVGLLLMTFQAKLGDANKFYYDENLKKWVEEGVEPTPELAPPPPPPTTSNFFGSSAPEESHTPPAPAAVAAKPGTPPMPPSSSNQFSSRRQSGVRSRYLLPTQISAMELLVKFFCRLGLPSVVSAFIPGFISTLAVVHLLFIIFRCLKASVQY